MLVVALGCVGVAGTVAPVENLVDGFHILIGLCRNKAQVAEFHLAALRKIDRHERTKDPVS